MKKYVAVLAATAVLGVTSAFAAHPFSDVTAQDWAYQAVERLAAEGVIEGYPDGTFKGQRNITRYEMAQMIARADAHKDEVTAEQKATIQRLAVEFANELQAFGVRVNKLEDQVGNFKFSGDMRVRYQNVGSSEGNSSGGSSSYFVIPGKSMFDYRARLKFEATVENTKAAVRINVADRELNKDIVNGDDAYKLGIDEAYVQHTFNNKVTATVGRKDFVVGNGLTYDDTFDGATLEVGTEKLKGIVSLGRIKDVKNEVSIYQLHYKPTDKLALKGFYIDRHSKKEPLEDKPKYSDIFGTSLDMNFGRNNEIWLGGEYARKASAGKAGEAWMAGIGYGHADMKKPGTWGVKAQYFDFNTDTFVLHTTYKVQTRKYLADKPNWRGERDRWGHDNYKGWLATFDYTLAKNLGLSAYASFDSKTQKGEPLAEYYRAEVNFQF